ncbi:MAG TPA: ATP-binding protein [Candidatus Limnocylindrales bacterium]|nr:ATP-binding protein [Candidatus Limnocylindrales bacterium]
MSSYDSNHPAASVEGPVDVAATLNEEGLGRTGGLRPRPRPPVLVGVEWGHERLRILERTGGILAAPADLKTRLLRVAELVIEHLADWCAIELLALDPPILVVTARDPDQVPRIERSILIDAAGAGDPVDGRGGVPAQRFGPAGRLVAPIEAEDGTRLGAILLGTQAARRFEPDDRMLLRDLGRRIQSATHRFRESHLLDRLRAAVDASADGIYMFEPDTLRISYVNHGGGDLVGRAPEALAGTTILQLQTRPAAHEFQARIELAKARPDTSAAFNTKLLRSDQHEIAVEAFLEIVTLPGGGATGILTARDVGEHIDLQAQLLRIAGHERRRAREMRAVIQAVGQGILVFDPTGRVISVNDAAIELLGREPRDYDDLVERLGLEAAAQDAGPVEVRPAVVSPDDHRWFEVTEYPAALGPDVNGERSLSRVVVLHDVSEARNAEAAHEAFLGVLSHELRTPTTTIFGYAKVLQRPTVQAEQAELLADIEVEADRLYRIVEDLLALTRLEGELIIDGVPLLLQHVAGPIISSEANRWDGVTFETALPARLPAVVGERTYVEQVLRNLVSNAGKYSPPGSVVHITAEAAPGEVLVRVLDRGPGIDPAEADRLFNLYYRSPTTARSPGSGIGLYVARGLIAAMQGRIWALPREGGGSEFGFSLPRCEEAAPDAAPDLDSSPANEGIGSSGSRVPGAELT